MNETEILIFRDIALNIFLVFWYQVDMRGYTEFQHWVCFPSWDPDQNPDRPDFRA